MKEKQISNFFISVVKHWWEFNFLKKTEKQKSAERQDTTKHCDARGSTALRTRNAPFSKSPGSPLAATLEKRKGKAAWSARIIT
jgi:hypothetical protein